MTVDFLQEGQVDMRTQIDWVADSRSFNNVAETYDEFRPDYPEELAETIVQKSGIPAGGKILEIGSGTGKATLPFARRGYSILCVEPGENLAKVAQKNLREWPGVRWEIATFQDCQASAGEFDLIISAQAFHWVPRPAGYVKAAALLKETGYLALFWNMAGALEGQVYEEVQQVYRERAPELDDGKSAEEVIQQREQELRACACFAGVEVIRFLWTRRRDTRQYLGLLNTHSTHLSMSAARRADLLEGIAGVVDRHGGVIDMPYQAVLYLARVIK
jgi:ubiquinone/menaquinone biosynthesis C-methylase UbiE